MNCILSYSFAKKAFNNKCKRKKTRQKHNENKWIDIVENKLCI